MTNSVVPMMYVCYWVAAVCGSSVRVFVLVAMVSFLIPFLIIGDVEFKAKKMIKSELSLK